MKMASISKNIFICFVVIFMISMNVYSQEYPKYGSEEWKKLSRAERKKSLQIPENQLKTISKTELIEAYLNFPLTPLIDAYNNRQKGFQRICDEFDGLKELMKREDVGACLINYYKQLEPDKYEESWGSIKRGNFSLRINYIELLISQEEIINNLKENEVKALLKDLLKKMDLKNKHYKLHSGYGLQATAFPITKLLYLKGKSNGYSQRIKNVSGMDSFIAGERISLERIPDIIIIANDYLRSN